MKSTWKCFLALALFNVHMKTKRTWTFWNTSNIDFCAYVHICNKPEHFRIKVCVWPNKNPWLCLTKWWRKCFWKGVTSEGNNLETWQRQTHWETKFRNLIRLKTQICCPTRTSSFQIENVIGNMGHFWTAPKASTPPIASNTHLTAVEFYSYTSHTHSLGRIEKAEIELFKHWTYWNFRFSHLKIRPFGIWNFGGVLPSDQQERTWCKSLNL